jgi:thioredoxin-related protein
MKNMSVIMKIVLLFACLVSAAVAPFGSLNAGARDSAASINLYNKANEVKEQDKVTILYFAASYCGFCEELNIDVIHPMLLNDEYRQKVKIREVLLDDPSPITGFGDGKSDPDSLVLKYDINVTPTLLFVDEMGDELAERLVGYQSRDFYWYYLDRSIDNALVRLKQADK